MNLSASNGNTMVSHPAASPTPLVWVKRRLYVAFLALKALGIS